MRPGTWSLKLRAIFSFFVGGLSSFFSGDGSPSSDEDGGVNSSKWNSSLCEDSLHFVAFPELEYFFHRTGSLVGVAKQVVGFAFVLEQPRPSMIIRYLYFSSSQSGSSKSTLSSRMSESSCTPRSVIIFLALVAINPPLSARLVFERQPPAHPTIRC